MLICLGSYFDTRLTNRTLDARVTLTARISFGTWYSAVSFSTLFSTSNRCEEEE